MKVTMKIIDDGNIDQRQLFRLVTKKMRAIIHEEEAEENMIGMNDEDNGSNNISAAVNSVEYGEGERRNDLTSLFRPNIHSLQLNITPLNNRNHEEKIQNVPFFLHETKGIEWNLSSVEPFSRNEHRIHEIYSKKLYCGWSAASLRVMAILIMDIISNTLLMIDVAQGSENMTAYRFARGWSTQSFSTIVILSVAILVTLMQMYAIVFTRLRTCPSLTVFAIPPKGFSTTSFKRFSVGDDDKENLGRVFAFVFLLVGAILFLSPSINWGAGIILAIFIVMIVIKEVWGRQNDRALFFLDFMMWWLELNTAFYLPFAHATSTATFVASAIDAAAELLELVNSVVGSIWGRNFEVGTKILLRPGASEEEIMWSYMNQNASQFVEVVIETDTLSKTDTTVELERFVMLLNYFSLDGAGTWSILAGSPTSWQLEPNGGVGKATITGHTNPQQDGTNNSNNDVHFFSSCGRNYKLMGNELTVTSEAFPPLGGKGSVVYATVK